MACRIVLQVLVMAWTLPASTANRGRGRGRDDGESGESRLKPRPGTLCQLVSREVLTEADTTTTPPTPAVHQLRFALPASARTPDCCGGESGMLHVRVKAPDAQGHMQVKPYSAHIFAANRSLFDLVVKVYPSGVSARLGSLAVHDFAHIPEMRAIDWRRDARRVGMVCFGVGITECLGPAEALLKAGGEVRIVYANRNAEQIVLVDELRRLLREHAGSFRLRHCLSQPSQGAALDLVKAGKAGDEKLTRGRVDHKVLKQEFAGPWKDGLEAEHFLAIGTSEMERSVLGLLGRAGLIDFSQIRGHPEFLLIKGPYGSNSDWTALSPPEPTPKKQRAERVEL